MDFTYSKTSHLGYIRDHRSRAGLSALTTSSHETLSIHLSQLAGGTSAGLPMHLNQFCRTVPLYPKVQGRGERSSAKPVLLSHRRIRRFNPFASDAAIPFHLKIRLCKACRSMTHAEYRVCTEQESLPYKDQKAIKKKLHVTLREGYYC